MLRAAALSTHPEAEEVASQILREDGSAMAAALGGFFAAAGSHPGVLFAPLTILVGGGGAGARVFDGRSRQPGIGAKRPRGFTPKDHIPKTAYVAVPGSIAATVVACAYAPGTTVRAVVQPGISAARQLAAQRRVELLDRVRSLGAGLLGDSRLRGLLLGELGPPQGGMWSSGDLVPPQDLDVPAAEVQGAWCPPWAVSSPEAASSSSEASDSSEPKVDSSQSLRAWREDRHAICTVDVRGVFVAVAFANCLDGFELPQLEVALPTRAVPVRRGVPRIEPGSALPAPAPIAIRRNALGQPTEVIASPRSLSLDAPELVVRRDPDTLATSTQRQFSGDH